MLQQTPPIATSTDEIRQIVREEIARALKNDPASRRACIIASKGTLDWAYPPLILATAAAAAGMESSVFFTFYGLNIIRRDFETRLKVSPVGNPAMPMPVPMPALLTSMPGMVGMATGMMKSFRWRSSAATRSEVRLSHRSSVGMVAMSAL